MEGQAQGLAPPIPTIYVTPHIDPTEDPGVLNQETKRKQKNSGLRTVQKALQAILTSSQVWKRAV